jgi:hypothetical protein
MSSVHITGLDYYFALKKSNINIKSDSIITTFKDNKYEFFNITGTRLTFCINTHTIIPYIVENKLCFTIIKNCTKQYIIQGDPRSKFWITDNNETIELQFSTEDANQIIKDIEVVKDYMLKILD